jgi:hypothetical protein
LVGWWSIYVKSSNLVDYFQKNRHKCVKNEGLLLIKEIQFVFFHKKCAQKHSIKPTRAINMSGIKKFPVEIKPKNSIFPGNYKTASASKHILSINFTAS